jgi:hypothetical protein
VNTQLEHIPRLATLAARRLARGDLETLRREANRSLDLQRLAVGTILEFPAHLLQRLHLAGGQGDADPVGLLLVSKISSVSQGRC